MRARTVAMLLAGRGMARLGQYLAGFALLALWGPTVFAGYAAALGVGGWLFVVAVAGVERAALVLDGRFESLFAWLGLAPFVVTLLGWAALLLALPGHVAVTYAAGLAFMAGTGSITVLVGLFRLRGRPGADAAAFAAVSGGYVVAVLLGGVAGVGVEGVLGGLVVIAAVINIALLLALRPGTPLGVHRKDLARVLRSVGLLATGDVVGGLVGSVLYALLAARSPAVQSSVYYVCTVLSTACGVLVVYLMRLWQRDLLRWLVEHADAARARLRRWLSGTAVAGAALTAVAALVVWRWGGTVVTAAVAVAVETALYVAQLVCVFVVESIDERNRMRSAVSAVVAMALVAVLALPCVLIGGAAGALTALSAGWVVRCVLLRGATRRVPAPVVA